MDKHLPLIALAILWPSMAFGQCSGIFPPGTFCGNTTASPAPPLPVTLNITGVAGPGTSTANGLALWAGTAGATLKDGAGQSVAGNYNWLGVVNFASVFQIGGNNMTFPASAQTLAALGVNQTWTGNNTIGGTTNLTGTFQSNGNVMTFPSVTATLAALNVPDQTVSSGANVTTQAQTTGSLAVDCGSRPLQSITNNGAWTITAPTNDGSCILKITNGASAATPTFSGFTVGTNIGDALSNVNGSIFFMTITRIGGTSTYVTKALQ